jgi:hypothetical protein
VHAAIRVDPQIINSIRHKRAHIELRPMAGWALAEGALMNDWQADLEDLFRQTANFAKSVELKIEVPRVPPRVIVNPVVSPRVAGSEREEIMKRVVSFKAHQRRAIREREEYAASVLVRLKATLSGQS